MYDYIFKSADSVTLILPFLFLRILDDDEMLGCFIAIVLSSISLSLFLITSSWGLVYNLTLTLFTGMFNCGPTSILTGSIPARIGQKVNAQATVSGVVNGTIIFSDT